jgi:hypothetical protein
MTVRRARSASRFTVAQLNFRRESLREALNIAVQTPLARGGLARGGAQNPKVKCRFSSEMPIFKGLHGRLWGVARRAMGGILKFLRFGALNCFQPTIGIRGGAHERDLGHASQPGGHG